MSRASMLTHTRGPGKRKTWEQSDSQTRCARKGCREYVTNFAATHEDPPYCSRRCAVGLQAKSEDQGLPYL
jgi:hypothetical protein